MSYFKHLRLSNKANPNGSPAASWLANNDSFVISVANPLRWIFKAPPKKTFLVKKIDFQVETLNISAVDDQQPHNINVTSFVHQLPRFKTFSGLSPRQSWMIFRSRFYYNKMGAATLMETVGTDDTEEELIISQTGTISPGTGDVFTGTRAFTTTFDASNGMRNPLRNTDWRYYDPKSDMDYPGGVVTAPNLLFSVAHGGVNNTEDYTTESFFDFFVVYDLVDRIKYVETRNI